VIGNESVELLVLQKATTLAQIALDTAASISAAIASSTKNPLNAITAGAAGAIQFAGTLASIFSAVGKAKSAVSDAKIPQRFMGGYFDAVGETDNKRYRARYVGSRQTGMLPSSPSLVLASEKGPEYFVSNDSLKNPKVLNYVRAIDNIQRGRSGRYEQYMEGGFTEGSEDLAVSTVSTTASSNGASTTAFDSELLRAVSRLNELLARGIEARLGDQTVLDINERFQELDDASGGVFTNN
jgi:hypothetical protein